MRESLKEFCNNNKSENVFAAEIGVMEGKNAEIILKALNNRLVNLFLIDLWSNSYRPEMNEKFAIVFNKFKEDNRIATYVIDSIEGVRLFEDDKIDYLYLDDSHEPEHVRQELELYWPKIKQGGMIAGHDINPDHPERVEYAVKSFCFDNNLKYESRMNEGEKVGDFWIWKK